MSDAVQEVDWYEKLTPKERQALEVYSREHSYRAVARVLGKSESVVDHHLQRARHKMGVTSTAEAMYMLAQRRARLAAKEWTAHSDISNHRPGSKPILRSRGILLSAIALLLLCLITSALFIKPGGVQSRHDALREMPLEQLKSEILALHGSSLVQLKKSTDLTSLIDELCVRAWNSSLGPKEDAVREAMRDVSGDILTVFNWAVDSDPKLAVRIAGNGHRILSRVLPKQDWEEMVDRACQLGSTPQQKEFGRVLCGFAFVHYETDPVGGLQSALQAAELFRSTPGCQWDEANALRHAGLCCKDDRESRIRFYDRAMQIYQQIHDSRGIAMTMLSYAQSGTQPETTGPDEQFADNVDWAVQAAEQFWNLQNLHYFKEAMGEVVTSERHVPEGERHRQLRQAVQSLYTTYAKVLHQDNEVQQELVVLNRKLHVDVALNDWIEFANDLETMLQSTNGAKFLIPNWCVVAGYYLGLCDRLHRQPIAEITYATGNQKGLDLVAKGRSLSVGHLLDTYTKPH